MSAVFKDSSEVIKFRKLFARLKDWSENDPAAVPDLACGDDGFAELCLGVLKTAGSIQRSEKSEHDQFTGPVDPQFISEWRDFEERFAGSLLTIRSNMAASGSMGLTYSFEYYEEPVQWVNADFKAILVAKAFDATIWFATNTAKNQLEDRPNKNWRTINEAALPDKLKHALNAEVRATIALEDQHEKIIDLLFDEWRMAEDENVRSQISNVLAQHELEHLESDKTPIEEIAEEAWTYWQQLKHETGLKLRGVIRRRALIPFVLFPRHVSARLSSTDLPSLYDYLRQAHRAFVFGVPFAALALMRSVLEMTLKKHYQADGVDLSAIIDSVNVQLPQGANAARLHRLRKLANNVLHEKNDGNFDKILTSDRNLEREIVSSLFALRVLVENAPSFRSQPPSNYR